MMEAHYWVVAGVVGVASVLTWEFISTFRRSWPIDRLEYLRRKYKPTSVLEENAAQNAVAEHQVWWRFIMGTAAALCWWGVVFMVLRK